MSVKFDSPGQERISTEYAWITCRRVDGVLTGPATLRVKRNDARVIKLNYANGALTGRWTVVTETQILHGDMVEPAAVFIVERRRATDNTDPRARPHRSFIAYFLTDGEYHAFMMGCELNDVSVRSTKCMLSVEDVPDRALIDMACALMSGSTLAPDCLLLEGILTDAGLADWYVRAR